MIRINDRIETIQGYVATNTTAQNAVQNHSQQSLNCQPATILSSGSCQQHRLQHTHNCQMIHRPLSASGSYGVNTVISQPNSYSALNTHVHMNTCPSGTKILS
jgi:hypothetical protein